MFNAFKRLALFLKGDTNDNLNSDRRFPPPQWPNPPYYPAQGEGLRTFNSNPSGIMNVRSNSNFPTAWTLPGHPYPYLYPYPYPSAPHLYPPPPNPGLPMNPPCPGIPGYDVEPIASNPLTFGPKIDPIQPYIPPVKPDPAPKQQAQELEDSPEYPQGNVEREISLAWESEQPEWKSNNWQWRSSGDRTRNGQQIELRVCLGVLQCRNCQRCTRPRTATRSRTKQISLPCALCASPSSLVHLTCTVTAHHYQTYRDGVTYLGWRQFGVHNHPRPPPDSLTAKQRNDIDSQVLRRSEASVHALRTGDTGPGSVPLSDISPLLANPRKARYEVAQSQARLGLANSGSTKGGPAFFSSLIALKDELKTDFFIDSSIHGPVYLTFQTPFMKRMLEESIDTWNKDTMDGPHSARHGLVTDGDHSFFSDGILNLTCAFSHVLTAWVPILYTWALRQDVDHNLPHFWHTSQQIVLYLQSKKIAFDPKYLLHVMDFSASQRKAHAEAYADALILTKPHYHLLSTAAQTAERLSFVEDAMQAQSGCDFHFWQSAERIKANGQVIPAELVDRFMHFLHTMTSKATTPERFLETTRSFSATFPRADKWLSWWLRPMIASMIFPSQSVVNPDTASQIPTTANPVEHGHSLLHHAVGKDQDLIIGIRKLFLHVSEFEKQYDAIKDGHFDPPGVREYRRPTRKVLDTNDGRPPDTLATLHPNGLRDNIVDSPHFLQAYQWDSPNSCFFDHGLEVWFRAVLLWPDDILEEFQKVVPHNSFLGTLFFHYKRRLKFLQSPTTPLNVSRDLALMQGITRNQIFNIWKIYHEANEYGCSREWLDFAVQDGNPSKEVKGFFGVYNVLNYQCSDGHVINKYATPNPQIILTLHHDSAALSLSRNPDNTITLNDYFMCFIPRNTVGEVLHTQPDIRCPCSSASCGSTASLTRISTLWPQVLNIGRENLVSDPKTELSFQNQFSIPDLDGTSIEYELVGRVLHANDHFTAQFRFGTRTYTYDDMKRSGHLVESKNTNLLSTFDPTTVYYVYHRISEKSMTCRMVEEVISDYKMYSKLPPSAQVDLTKSVSPSPPNSPPVPTKTLPSVSKPLPDNLRVCDKPDCAHKERTQSDNVVNCTMCGTPWHEACVIDSFVSEYIRRCDEAWCCLACITEVNGPWDQMLLGEYILVKTRLQGCYFPAHIIRRVDEATVHLKWHKNNVYGRNQKPDSPEFCLTPQQCFYAYHRDVFDYTKALKSNIGSIKWPARLSKEDPVMKKYQSTEVRLALEDAFHSVFQILMGVTSHPIMTLFQEWEQTHTPAKTGSTSARLAADFKNERQFTNLFSLDILPCDRSLIEPLFVSLQLALMEEKSVKAEVFTHFRLISHVLFSTVIIRVYMKKLPKDDLQIYTLTLDPLKIDRSLLSTDDPLGEAKETHLSRMLTDSEKAAQSCIQAQKDKDGIWNRNAHMLGCLASFSHLTEFQQLRQVIDYSPDLNDNLPVIKTVNKQGSPYIFADSADLGLTGGPPYVSRCLEFSDDMEKKSTVPGPLSSEDTIKGPTESTLSMENKITVPLQSNNPANPPNLAPEIPKPKARLLIEDYMTRKKPVSQVKNTSTLEAPKKGTKRPSNPENLRRSKRIKKE